MNNSFCKGDVVVCLAGRDSGKTFLIIEIVGKRAKLVDGKKRKVKTPKLKNLKHIQRQGQTTLVALADEIASGMPVANGRVKKALKP